MVDSNTKQNIIPDVFDNVANSYDDEFTNTLLGRDLRKLVWNVYHKYFNEDNSLLELTCGTGEDAIYLSNNNINVTATDASEEMINISRMKADAQCNKLKPEFKKLSLQEINSNQFANKTFDGIFSNFGGMNTIFDFSEFANNSAGIIKQNGFLILVFISPFCIWEQIYYLLKINPTKAFRRFHKQVKVKVGDEIIKICYPFPKEIKKTFNNHYKHIETRSLGILMPPSYHSHIYKKYYKLLKSNLVVEKLFSGITKFIGDHYIIVFQKK